jgi:hypothetical protein
MSPSMSVLMEMWGELTPSQLVTSKPGQGLPGQTAQAVFGQALVSDQACAWFCSAAIWARLRRLTKTWPGPSILCLCRYACIPIQKILPSHHIRGPLSVAGTHKTLVSQYPDLLPLRLVPTSSDMQCSPTPPSLCPLSHLLRPPP